MCQFVINRGEKVIHFLIFEIVTINLHQTQNLRLNCHPSRVGEIPSHVCVIGEDMKHDGDDC